MDTHHEPVEIRMPQRPTRSLLDEPEPGVFDLIGDNFGAWKHEVATNATVRRLQNEARLIEERRLVEVAKQRAFQTRLETERLRLVAERFPAEVALEARRDVATLKRDVFAAERDAFEHELDAAQVKRLRSLPAHEAIEQLREEVSVEQLLADREALRQRARLARTTQLPTPISGAAEGGSPAMEPFISSESIRAVALQALNRLASLPPDQTDTECERWRLELYSRYPRYAAEAIERAFDEHRQLIG